MRVSPKSFLSHTAVSAVTTFARRFTSTAQRSVDRSLGSSEIENEKKISVKTFITDDPYALDKQPNIFLLEWLEDTKFNIVFKDNLYDDYAGVENCENGGFPPLKRWVDNV